MTAAIDSRREAGSAGATGNSPSCAEATLLFVDDEPSLLNALKRAFRIRKQYRILTAENGLAALKVLEHEQVSIIVSDYRMPGMTGIEFLRLAKSYDPKVICIMLSGQAEAKEVTLAVSEGLLYKFLRKPHSNTELVNSVDVAVRQYQLIHQEKLSHWTAKALPQGASPALQPSPLGSILVREGLLLPAQLEMAEDYCQQHKVSLARALLCMEMLDDSTLLDTARRESGLTPVSLLETTPDPTLISLVGRDICESGLLVPLSKSSQSIGLAIADPLDMPRIDMISFTTRLLIRPVLASAGDIGSLIERTSDVTEPTTELPNRPPSRKIEADGRDERELTLSDRTPLLSQLVSQTDELRAVELVNSIMAEAVHCGASDIHLEPKSTHSIVRYRVDGMLREAARLPASLHLSTMSRLKILARMDISVKRIPQDGRLTLRNGTRVIDVRVSTMPTVSGEKAVCRLLDKSANVRALEDLGLSEQSLEQFQNMISAPQGIIIATGPTGSGKTTTLYSSLCARLAPTHNFVTIEDPVEYFVEDAAQVHIDNKISLTFAASLRATLRQDPDVILVGEIRDLETAQAAFQAAMTGHLVFTSLHTNSAVAAITRLVHLGVEPFLIASSVRGIIAQRLARRVCKECQMPVPTDLRLISRLGLSPEGFPDTLLMGGGCKKCGQTGYSGRVGLYELFQMTEDTRHLIASGYSETQLFEKTRSQGMSRLLDDGKLKVIAGETTLNELMRVLGPSAEPGFPCPDCGRHLESNYVACPHCGKRQSAICHVCKAKLNTDWTVCPMCGSSQA